MLKLNKIYCGSATEILKQIDNESINCCITSPPYWALRDYEAEPIIWDGDENCRHKWGGGIKILKHKPGETNPGLEKWYKDKGGLGDVWVRPSRIEYAGRTIDEVCPVCNKKFEGKPGQRFCSIKCLNTLPNIERTTQGGLSNFCSKCGAWKGSLGLEPTFDLYIKHLCNIFDEVKRVLRKNGTCWVVIGDTYYGGKGTGGDIDNSKQVWTWKEKVKRLCQNCGKEFLGWKFQNFCGPACSGVDNTPRVKKGKMPDKSLIMIPFRFAIEMVNRGWILRNTIIWYKPNCMPSSVKDRFTVDFEYVFFFVKNKKYWFEQQFEPIKLDSVKRERRGNKENKYSKDEYFPKGVHANTMSQPRNYKGYNGIEEEFTNRQGRNKRTVWEISTKSFSEAHFAVFPEELIEPMLKAGCPEFVCSGCGKPREKIYKSITSFHSGSGKAGNLPKGKWEGREQEISGDYDIRMGPVIDREEIGLTDCGCNAGFEPGITLDPFIGKGTTAIVAKKQGKNFIGIELNPEYVEMANRGLANTYYQEELIK